jgi:fermentation-respiration switch protein FrsA (DUF1100 family)
VAFQQGSGQQSGGQLVGLPVPQSLTDVAKWMARYRYDVDWSSLDYLKGAARIQAPILLFQGTADQTVP